MGSEVPLSSSDTNHGSTTSGGSRNSGESYNLDDITQFKECRRLLMNEDVQNFVVDFGEEDATCGFDLTESDFAILLKSPVSLLRTQHAQEASRRFVRNNYIHYYYRNTHESSVLETEICSD